MAIDPGTQERIKTLLREFMNSWIARQYDEVRRIEEAGFSPSGVLAPFHDALVPGIRGLGERGFSTALGNLHERIAHVIGEHAHAAARRAFDLTGQLPVLAREFITQRINQLSRGEAVPDHGYEREQLLSAFGDEVHATTRIDLWLKKHGGEDHYFEMKSAKPNRGQCIEMKQRQLAALGIRRDVNALHGGAFRTTLTAESTHMRTPTRCASSTSRTRSRSEPTSGTSSATTTERTSYFSACTEGLGVSTRIASTSYAPQSLLAPPKARSRTGCCRPPV
jgi:hypothetical protein